MRRKKRIKLKMKPVKAKRTANKSLVVGGHKQQRRNDDNTGENKRHGTKKVELPINR